jgi:hypothetical protein
VTADRLKYSSQSDGPLWLGPVTVCGLQQVTDWKGEKFMYSAVNSICGLELNNPDSELFKIRILTPQTTSEERVPSHKCPGSCWSCPFLMECIGPEVRCLAPKKSQLYELGREKFEDGVSITYFASEQNGGTVFFRLTEPAYHWASISQVEANEVPHWAISAFES